MRSGIKAYIISFPRDMYVNIPGYGKNKINAAFAFGGAPLAVRTLENLTGVRMDHVVLIDFEGFIRLTEDLHGVTVTNKTAFSSHGFDYPKGKITIAGEEALWFVRERHQLPGGDLDRAENQRNVIKAIVQKGLSAESGLRSGHLHQLHRQCGEAPYGRQRPERWRDQAYRSLAPADRQGHRTAAGPDLRFCNHAGRAEH